jgi:hypothetical protein
MCIYTSPAKPFNAALPLVASKVKVTGALSTGKAGLTVSKPTSVVGTGETGVGSPPAPEGLFLQAELVSNRPMKKV